ncbi:PIN domain-containing protein [Bifidobacterium ramosum]|uniref:PIN domain-containing protein n=1 Tax=Bifidobacterium ramosum TaxID=1798158 RepID=A0A6L4WYM3_9BIFI|nr:PIN domain-containing protein [Bifidobacterium ramosum]KAB8286759.1 PIN domain-containing protein [Bifidobacterium ramosum]NEG72755.1 PIN domain-containing protein [Bifidobacterium ramosum]
MKAFIDANVFVSKWICDVTLSVAESSLCELSWSSKVLDEAREPLKRLQKLDDMTVDRYYRAMNRAFPQANVDGWEPLEQSIVLPDLDDRHVVAAAMQAGVDVIVTFNLKDFPLDALAEFGLRAVSPDMFLVSIIDGHPEETLRVMNALVSSKKRPPRTMQEEIQHLRATGAPLFASRLEEFLS